MKKLKLIEPKLIGDRFRGGALPFETFKDLQALQDAIFELARDDFFAKNPDRKRLPRNYFGDASFQITSLREGSCSAEVSLHSSSLHDSSLLGMEGSASVQSLMRGRDQLEAAYIAINDGKIQDVPQMSKRAWRTVAKLGLGLRDDEEMVLGRKGGKEARITKQTRQTLLRSQPGVQEISDDLDLFCRVKYVDPSSFKVVVILEEDRTLAFQTSEEIFEEVQELTTREIPITWMRIQGIGIYGLDERLKRVETITALEVLESNDPNIRLTELSFLKDGWYNGIGKAVDSSILELVRTWLNNSLTEEISPPRIYPTPEGGLELEWRWDNQDLSVEFDPSENHIDWHRINVSSSADEEDDIHSYARDKSGLQQLTAKLHVTEPRDDKSAFIGKEAT